MSDYDQGYDAGIADGWENGYSDGMRSGREEGFSEGADEGYEKGEKETTQRFEIEIDNLKYAYASKIKHLHAKILELQDEIYNIRKDNAATTRTLRKSIE